MTGPSTANRRSILGVVAALLSTTLTGCATFAELSLASIDSAHAQFRVLAALPIGSGWYQGQRVHYVVTDISDRDLARKAGANYAPRLADAIPSDPQGPGLRHALERIYDVANFAQDKILPSVPLPTGAESESRDYSPLWRVVTVIWQPSATPRVLQSEEDVLAAEERGEVRLALTRIVINCPVVASTGGGTLPGLPILGAAR